MIPWIEPPIRSSFQFIRPSTDDATEKKTFKHNKFYEIIKNKSFMEFIPLSATDYYFSIKD